MITKVKWQMHVAPFLEKGHCYNQIQQPRMATNMQLHFLRRLFLEVPPLLNQDQLKLLHIMGNTVVMLQDPNLTKDIRNIQNNQC